MAYDRRDRIGHWVTRKQQPGQHCQHACCRGYREHPRDYPVILANRQLRSASDDDLARHFTKLAETDTREARRSEAQILHEMDRRDRADTRRQEREQRKRARWEATQATRAAARMDREAETERIRLEAETATNGYLVNKQGRARGVNPEEILRGRTAVFQRYASDEAREYFRVNPRPTSAYFRGQNTRQAERYRLRD